MPSKKISIVIPVYNEEENIHELHKQLLETIGSFEEKNEWEIIFVDDGSTDKTHEKCLDLSPLTIIKLRKNFGQTAAFDAGFKQATGDIIITLDGDLQNDPADIPKLLGKMEEGFDAVSGWRKHRKDTLSKKVTSRTANIIRKIIFKDSIHDSGCALKAYRKECFNDLDLYGEMHRFIPALLESQGYKVAEVVVNHRERLYGQSKYGNIKRGVKSLSDMIAVWFWDKYAARPLHIFGSAGIFTTILGSGLLAALFIGRLFFNISLADKIWPLIGIFLIITGIQLFTIGILTDFLSKIYFKSHGRMNYFISHVTENK